jgi:AraC family transcriptional regulator of adaptative response/methylated-DNA-[protein]-cysteine methyltransferase
MNALPSIAEMHQAAEAKDTGYDGIFYVCVRTTGIFCLPSCPARTPMRKNRDYLPDVKSALLAGYRPCKRCHPLNAPNSPPKWMLQLLAKVEEDPARRLTDQQLRKLGVDPVQARRYFHKHHGMTFQAYCRMRRLGEAFRLIRKGAKLDDIALEHGYDSLSGFRDAFGKLFGEPPGRVDPRRCLAISWMESALGPLLIGATDKELCLLEFSDRRAIESQIKGLRGYFQLPIVPGKNEPIEQTLNELTEYFAGKRTKFSVPLAYPGTPFQQKVWGELCKIPYGETRSYESIAIAVSATPNACRAVGRANGLNRIGIIIPCHRVVNKNGSLCGYGGGLWRKQFLLDLERSKMTR